MAVFTWFPNAGHSLSVEPRVASAKFGDGYEQRVPNGINFILEKWSLTFSGTRQNMGLVEAFLRTHAGVTSFDWTNPDEVAGKFVCKSWTKSRDKGVVNITCVFEQVPA